MRLCVCLFICVCTREKDGMIHLYIYIYIDIRNKVCQVISVYGCFLVAYVIFEASDVHVRL